MKRFFYGATALALSLCILAPQTSAITTSAESAIAIDADGGTVIYEKNADERRGMASTTKIMTALIALENCPLDKVVKVSDKAIGVEGSSIYLQRGESLTMEQLLYALTLQSANDAATAIAIEVGGSVEGFSALMNKKAEEMGLKNTSFSNPHGLDDENHYTTARELALIASEALKNPTFKQMVSTKTTKIPLNGDEGTRVLVNHNKMLRLYDGAVGVKTGFTKKCGRCLVSAAERDGLTIVAVTLNAPDDWNDHRIMLDAGFEKLERIDLAKPGGLTYRVPVVGGEKPYVTIANPEGLSLTFEKGSANITSEVIFDKFLFAPLQENERLGEVIFYNDGQEIGRLDLLAQSSVTQRPVKKKLFGIF